MNVEWYNVLMKLDKRIDQEFSDSTWRSATHRFVRVYKGHAKKQAMEILNMKTYKNTAKYTAKGLLLYSNKSSENGLTK